MTRFILTIMLLLSIGFSNVAFGMFEAEPETESGFLTSIQQKLVNFVQKTVTTVRHNNYRYGGTLFDVSRGVYALDCSTYVNQILKTVYPRAFFNLVTSTGAEKPASQHYYNFFQELAEESNDYWNKIDDVEELRPGDVLVFRNKNSLRRAGNHVMVVMNKPIWDTDAFLVQVADSAPSGHSQDTRRSKTSGIGIGTLLLKVNPKTGQPSAYAWKVGAYWKNNVNIVMARPTDLG